jgi:hypothetical protein
LYPSTLIQGKYDVLKTTYLVKWAPGNLTTSQFVFMGGRLHPWANSL